MDVYILDHELLRRYVIDEYTSFIWTERWNKIGDFRMEIESTIKSRGIFRPGALLSIKDSDRIMMVETIEDTLNDDGTAKLLVSGRSLELILDNRILADFVDSGTGALKFVGTPPDVIYEMFDLVCRTPAAISVEDQIPHLMSNTGSPFDTGTIPFYSSNIRVKEKATTLYSVFQPICEKYDMGLRLICDKENQGLYFDVYTGTDRTTRQGVVSPVVFSVDLENLLNTRELVSIENFKNVVYVVDEEGYDAISQPNAYGFNRRVTVVDPSIDSDETDIPGALEQAGNEVLQDSRRDEVFDGEISQYSQFRYGEHYSLGDIVELRNRDGVVTYKRVTEQIFVCDAEGVRGYPTLALGVTTDLNTWLDEEEAPAYIDEWDEQGADVWSDV